MPRLELGAPFRPAAVLTAVLICAGCAPTVPHSSADPHNMYVTTTTDAGEPLAATRAWLEVQRVTLGCRGEVEGEIYLRGPTDSLYLPHRKACRAGSFRDRTSPPALPAEGGYAPGSHHVASNMLILLAHANRFSAVLRMAFARSISTRTTGWR